MNAEIDHRLTDNPVIPEKKSTPTELLGKINLEEGRMQLDLTADGFNLPETMNFLGDHWVRKAEFHVTILRSKKEIARELKGINPPEALSNNEAERKVNGSINDISEGKSFKVKLGNEIRVIQDGDRKTIVRMVEVEGIDNFLQGLGEKLGFPIEKTPTHVTLYTLENGKSIGISNEADLKRMTQELTHFDNQKLKKTLGLIGITGSAYGWGKIARVISEDLFVETLGGNNDNFVFVDLCSSLPIFAQIMRERHLDRCYAQAKKIAGDVSVAIQQPPDRIQEAFGGHFNVNGKDPERIRKLREAIAPIKAPLRKIITSIIQDVLYSTSFSNESETEREERLTELFLAGLKTSDVVYESFYELEGKKGRGGWEIKKPNHKGITTEKELMGILGEDDGRTFTKDMAFLLARKSLPHIRGFKVISVDIAHPNQLTEDAKNSFPEDFRETEFYRRIVEFKDHLQADISQLQLPEKSVSFFTCFEGWPFYKIGNKTVDLRFAEIIFRALKSGGKALFFPWQVQSQTGEDEHRLEEIKAYWQSKGLIITTQEHGRAKLIEKMGDRELMLTDHSPVFAEPNDVFKLLIVEKPREIS